MLVDRPVPGSRAPAGRVRVDCHLHTVASGDSVLTLEQLAERARQAALDVVCVTDHNVTSAAVAAAERDLGVRVIIGEEIRTPGQAASRPVRGRGGGHHRGLQREGRRPGAERAGGQPGGAVLAARRGGVRRP